MKDLYLVDPNVIKHNNDLLYLVSNTGNKVVVRVVTKVFVVIKVGVIIVYMQKMFVIYPDDTTFVFLRENTVLINPHRVNWRNL